MQKTPIARLNSARLRILTIGGILAVAFGAISVAPVAAAQAVNVGCTAGTGNVPQLVKELRRANGRSAQDVTVITLGRNCTYLLGSAAGNPSYGATGLPVVARHVIIHGRHAVIKRAGSAPQFRILAVGVTGNLTLIDLKITKGRAPDGVPGMDNTGGTPGTAGKPGKRGGGIYNLGQLTLDRVTVRGNTAGTGGHGGSGTSSNGDPGVGLGANGHDAANTAGGNGGRGGGGGGIYNAGTLVITGSTISRNRTGRGGGGGAATAGNGGDASDGTPGGHGGVGGDAVGGTGGNGGDGGAVLDVGALFIKDSVVADNAASAAGVGGEATGGKGGTGGDPSGGGGNSGHAQTIGGDGGTGAITVSGTASLNSTSITDNTGGAYGNGTAAAMVGGDGGCGGIGGQGGSYQINTGSTGGGGIALDGGSVLIWNVTLSGNDSEGPGGVTGAAAPPGSSPPPC